MKEVNILKFLKFLLTKIVIILVCAAIGASAAFAYSKLFVEPVYRTQTSILVSNGGFSDSAVGSSVVSGQNISASLSLIPTCVEILKSDKVFEDMKTYLNDDKYSASSLRSSFLPVARSETSLIIDIYTYSQDPKEAVMLANTFLEIIPAFVPNTIHENVEVKILNTAKHASQTEPRTLFNIGVGTIVLAGLCILVLFIIFLTKNTIDNEDDLKKNYDIPMLGVVPLFENKQSGDKRNGKTRK